VKVGLKIHEDREELEVSRSLEISTKFNIVSGKALEHKQSLNTSGTESLSHLESLKKLLQENVKDKYILNSQFDSKTKKIRNRIASLLTQIYTLASKSSLRKSSEIKDLMSLERKMVENEMKRKQLKGSGESNKVKTKSLEKLSEEIQLGMNSNKAEERILEHEYAFQRLDSQKFIDSYEFAIRKDGIDRGEEDLRVGFKVNFNLGEDGLDSKFNSQKYIQKKVRAAKDNIKNEQDMLSEYHEIKNKIKTLKSLQQMKSFKRLKKSTKNSKLLRTLSRKDRLNLELEVNEFQLELN
jgi:ribosomal protein S17E